MRFPWSRRHDVDLAQLEEARRSRAQTEARWPAVREAAANMQKHHDRNGFAEAIRAAMGVKR